MRRAQGSVSRLARVLARARRSGTPGARESEQGQLNRGRPFGLGAGLLAAPPRRGPGGARARRGGPADAVTPGQFPDLIGELSLVGLGCVSAAAVQAAVGADEVGEVLAEP